MNPFKVIIVEDVPLELKGTEGILRNDIPEAQIIGTADNEAAYWKCLKQEVPDLVLLDLGLGGSTTIGVELCRHTKEMHPATALFSRVAKCSPVAMLPVSWMASAWCSISPF